MMVPGILCRVCAELSLSSRAYCTESNTMTLFGVQYIFCMYLLKVVVVVHTSQLWMIFCQFSSSHNDSLIWYVNFDYCIIIASKHLVRFNGPYSEFVSINTFQSIRQVSKQSGEPGLMAYCTRVHSLSGRPRVSDLSASWDYWLPVKSARETTTWWKWKYSDGLPGIRPALQSLIYKYRPAVLPVEEQEEKIIKFANWCKVSQIEKAPIDESQT